MEVKSRHHLRSDAVADLESTLTEGVGVELGGDTYERVEFEEAAYEVILIDGEPRVAFFDGEPFLTVRGANEYELSQRVVVVDTGAISFVSSGADVMRPGITDVKGTITAGDLVLIAEESHGKVLAIGRARVDDNEMRGDSGKVVDSIHYVGDELYEFSG